MNGQATNLGAPLERIVQIVRKRGLILLISDFLAPLERLETDLSSLAACGHEVLLFQLLDPAELNFEFKSPAIFEDLESSRTFFIDPGSARKEYLRKLENHCAALRATCERLGIWYDRLSTDRPLEMVLFNFLRQRMLRGKSKLRLGRQNRVSSAIK
jgi:uncharacterized protein (DUF58 family)